MRLSSPALSSALIQALRSSYAGMRSLITILSAPANLPFHPDINRRDGAGLALKPAAGSGSVGVPDVRTSFARISYLPPLATTTDVVSLKESRMKVLEITKLDRKSGIRGPKMMGEAQPQPF